MMNICDHKCHLYDSDLKIIDMLRSGVISDEERGLAMKKTCYAWRMIFYNEIR